MQATQTLPFSPCSCLFNVYSRPASNRFDTNAAQALQIILSRTVTSIQACTFLYLPFLYTTVVNMQPLAGAKFRDAWTRLPPPPTVATKLPIRKWLPTLILTTFLGIGMWQYGCLKYGLEWVTFLHCLYQFSESLLLETMWPAWLFMHEESASLTNASWSAIIAYRFCSWFLAVARFAVFFMLQM
jgi:hypothetical protein